MLRHKFLCWLTRGSYTFEIPGEDGEPYITRYIVTKFGVRFFVHQYHTADREPWLHDHPWGCVGIPLIGGYMEERLVRLCPLQGMVTKLRHIWTFRVNIIQTNTFHRIVAIRPGTWTVFFHTKRTGAFGFLKQSKSWGDDRWTITYHQPKDGVLEYSRRLMKNV